MTWQKKYIWGRTTFGDELPTELGRDDYCGYDGDQYIGRIFYETGGPTKGLWRWAGACPRPMRGSPNMPNCGYAPTAADAARIVEDYWDRMKVVLAERWKLGDSGDGTNANIVWHPDRC